MWPRSAPPSIPQRNRPYAATAPVARELQHEPDGRGSYPSEAPERAEGVALLSAAGAGGWGLVLLWRVWSGERVSGAAEATAALAGCRRGPPSSSSRPCSSPVSRRVAVVDDVLRHGSSARW
jgi:hypothetical protein